MSERILDRAEVADACGFGAIASVNKTLQRAREERLAAFKTAHDGRAPKDAAELAEWTEQQIRSGAAVPLFPEPAGKTSRSPYWHEHEIDRWKLYRRGRGQPSAETRERILAEQRAREAELVAAARG